MASSTFKKIAVFYILMVLFLNFTCIIPFNDPSLGKCNPNTINTPSMTSDIQYIGNMSSGQLNISFRDRLRETPISTVTGVFVNIVPGSDYILTILNLLKQMINFSFVPTGSPRVDFWLNSLLLITKLLALVGVVEFLPGVG